MAFVRAFNETEETETDKLKISMRRWRIWLELHHRPPRFACLGRAPPKPARRLPSGEQGPKVVEIDNSPKLSTALAKKLADARKVPMVQAPSASERTGVNKSLRPGLSRLLSQYGENELLTFDLEEWRTLGLQIKGGLRSRHFVRVVDTASTDATSSDHNYLYYRPVSRRARRNWTRLRRHAVRLHGLRWTLCYKRPVNGRLIEQEGVTALLSERSEDKLAVLSLDEWDSFPMLHHAAGCFLQTRVDPVGEEVSTTAFWVCNQASFGLDMAKLIKHAEDMALVGRDAYRIELELHRAGGVTHWLLNVDTDEVALSSFARVGSAASQDGGETADDLTTVAPPGWNPASEGLRAPTATRGFDLRCIDLSDHSLSRVLDHDPTFNLRKADLRGSILEKTQLARVDLTGANLERADLTGTRFRGANLTGVRFHRAKVSHDTIFEGATFSVLLPPRRPKVKVEKERLAFQAMHNAYSVLKKKAFTLCSGSLFGGEDEDGDEEEEDDDEDEDEEDESMETAWEEMAMQLMTWALTGVATSSKTAIVVVADVAVELARHSMRLTGEQDESGSSSEQAVLLEKLIAIIERKGRRNYGENTEKRVEALQAKAYKELLNSWMRPMLSRVKTWQARHPKVYNKMVEELADQQKKIDIEQAQQVRAAAASANQGRENSLSKKSLALPLVSRLPPPDPPPSPPAPWSRKGARAGQPTELFEIAADAPAQTPLPLTASGSVKEDKATKRIRSASRGESGAGKGGQITHLHGKGDAAKGSLVEELDAFLADLFVNDIGELSSAMQRSASLLSQRVAAAAQAADRASGSQGDMLEACRVALKPVLTKLSLEATNCWVQHCKVALFRAVQKAMKGVGRESRASAKVAEQLKEFEAQLGVTLNETLSASAGFGEKSKLRVFRDVSKLAKGLANKYARTSLTARSRYQKLMKSPVSMMLFANRQPTSKLTKDQTELEYLAKQIKTLQAIECNADTWRDLTQLWRAFLRLRTTMTTERGQQIMEDVLSNPFILSALGMAMQLFFTAGEPPLELLNVLQLGPMAHMRQHAYDYTSSVELELERIARLKATKKQTIAIGASFFLAMLLMTTNFLSATLVEILPLAEMLGFDGLMAQAEVVDNATLAASLSQ